MKSGKIKIIIYAFILSVGFISFYQGKGIGAGQNGQYTGQEAQDVSGNSIQLFCDLEDPL